MNTQLIRDKLCRDDSDMLAPLSEAFLVLFDAWFLDRRLSADEQRLVARAWAMVQARVTLEQMVEESNEDHQ